MEYDYGKIVDFIFGKRNESLYEIIKYILSKEFTMLDVNIPNKMILLQKKEFKYVIFKEKDRILIIPDNYKSLCLTDDFGEILEISINNDGNISISKIFNLDKPRGIAATTSTWNYESKLYSEVVGRALFVDYEKLNSIYSHESLDMFLNKYYELRTDVLKDLFWDLTLFLKNNFIETNISERVMISDGFSKDKFEILYKKHIDKVFETIDKKEKPGLF